MRFRRSQPSRDLPVGFSLDALLTADALLQQMRSEGPPDLIEGLREALKQLPGLHTSDSERFYDEVRLAASWIGSMESVR